MELDPAEIKSVLDLLAQAPKQIASASQGHDNSRLTVSPVPEAWSANDILAHLRACADVWGKSILAMISQDHPTLRYVSPRTWMRKTNYPSLEFDVSFAAFTKQRNELLQSLKALAIEEWSRGATFTGTTRGREQTILSYAQRLAHHEGEHLQEIENLLKPD